METAGKKRVGPATLMAKKCFITGNHSCAVVSMKKDSEFNVEGKQTTPSRGYGGGGDSLIYPINENNMGNV